MKLIDKYYCGADKLKDISLLFIRLILAYGFFNPAMMKIKDVNSIADWFGSMNIPFPHLNAYLSTGTEVLGVILLTLGLFSRIISIPLIITMIVAIITVHWSNGFEAGNNGFEIPLYYMIMLFALIAFGSGKFSVDYLLGKRSRKTEKGNVLV
ncbi:HvfX family Cu-binding RiPP maturation protein [Elizabethkingia miricola]|uniref:DoxX family protein n=2 Tax=Elizabethkingia TaxID=308865 RepID=A0ABD5B8D6_ELIMR|nr:DoxX family protein [Elizabethkingia miricola]MBS1740488.1 DoxX family protein [Bacteroidota bacterium]MDQ8750068.1 DoxX family protein [Elizabethkingia miricola]MDV3663232.1 DoxX family protein [Elizabethkingia anophelis]